MLTKCELCIIYSVFDIKHEGFALDPLQFKGSLPCCKHMGTTNGGNNVGFRL